MKRVSCWFLMSLWAAAGCVTLPTLWHDEQKASPASQAAGPAKPTGPVAADQVTETNAREKAKALQDELDRDEKALNPPPVAPEPDRKK